MIISLWSGPRNVSTALMYSFSQRSDMIVIDEPFYGYYLDFTGIKHPGSDEFLPMLEKSSDKIIKDIREKGNSDEKHLFIKNMAHHLIDLDHNFLEEYVNIFLIRDPKEMLPSLIKQIPTPTMLDTAYKMQYDLFVELSSKQKEKPIIIDSGQLLQDPEGILSQVCKCLAIPWDSEMLSWPPGPLPEDGLWSKYWYSSVHKSSGFEKYKQKNAPIPDELSSLYHECDTYYKILFSYALKSESTYEGS